MEVKLNQLQQAGLQWAAEQSVAGKTDEDGKPIAAPTPEEYLQTIVASATDSYVRGMAEARAKAVTDAFLAAPPNKQEEFAQKVEPLAQSMLGMEA